MGKELFSGMTAKDYDAKRVEAVLRDEMGAYGSSYGLHGSLFPTKRRRGEIKGFMSPDGLSGGIIYASGVATQPVAQEVMVRRKALNGVFFKHYGFKPVSEALLHTHSPSYRLYVAVHEAVHVVTDYVWTSALSGPQSWIKAYSDRSEKEKVADAGALLYILSNFDGEKENNHLAQEAIAWRSVIPRSTHDTIDVMQQAVAEYREENVKGLSLGDVASWALGIVPRGSFDVGEFVGLVTAEHDICGRLRSVSYDHAGEMHDTLDKRQHFTASLVHAQKIAQAFTGHHYLVENCNVLGS